MGAGNNLHVLRQKKSVRKYRNPEHDISNYDTLVYQKVYSNFSPIFLLWDHKIFLPFYAPGTVTCLLSSLYHKKWRHRHLENNLNTQVFFLNFLQSIPIRFCPFCLITLTYDYPSMDLSIKYCIQFSLSVYMFIFNISRVI